jgi:hypothetical protein
MLSKKPRKLDCREKIDFKTREKMDQRAILDHQFTVAAYAITWAIQLGYVAWLTLKWRAQKRAATRASRNQH